MKLLRPIFNCLFNIFLAYFCLFVCRVVFVAQNWDAMAAGVENLDALKVIRGSLLFDTSAVSYTHILYIFLALLPIPLRNRRWYRIVCKTYYLVVNSASILLNFIDSTYFPFSARRSTISTLTEFQNESIGNIFKIFGIEILHNWYLVLIAAALFAMLYYLYKDTCDCGNFGSLSKNIAARVVSGLVWASLFALCFAGMRGGFTRKTRPVANGYAMKYVERPEHANAILNTTFSVLRNIPPKGLSPVEYMPEEEVPLHYSAVHKACAGSWTGERKPNIVILIVESLAQEYIGSYNGYLGYTPFVDSLRSVSLSFREGFANGNKSVDALPAVLSSIPWMDEHLLMSEYALNNLGSLVLELKESGYSSAFYHGGAEGTMGFNSYVLSVGVEKTYSYNEFCKDPRFGGRRDYDGLWAIWDEEFLQFAALNMDQGEPFVGTIFTATSHHPYHIPERYKERFATPGSPMYACVRYTDYSLRRFFETASRQSWYDNTIFVLTADHTNFSERPEYDNLQGKFRVPFIIFDPSGHLPRGVVDRSIQHIDIMPTLLGIIGAPRDYIAFGKDVLDPATPDWTYFYNGQHHIQGDADSLFLKAFIQDYTSRMIENNLLVK